MKKLGCIVLPAAILAITFIVHAATDKIDAANLLTGSSAFADYRSEKPGVFRKITANDLPKPFATKSAENFPRLVPRPEDAWPHAPTGFKVDLYATNLNEPRQIRVAPNGDFFVAESRLGEIRIFRGVGKDGKPEQTSVFASGLKQPFGIAFYPLGANPQWVYIGNTNSVVRFPYRNGDLKATGPAQTLISVGPGMWSSRSTANGCLWRWDRAPISMIPILIHPNSIGLTFWNTRPRGSLCESTGPGFAIRLGWL